MTVFAWKGVTGISAVGVVGGLLWMSMAVSPAVYAQAMTTPGVSKTPPGKGQPPTPALLPVTRPYSYWNGLVAVDELVNGRLESLVLDTGLSANAVRPDACPRLQLAMLPAKVQVNVFNTTSEVATVKLKSIRFGLFSVEDIPAAALDVPALLSHTPHPDAPAVWLGFPFLSSYQVTFDFTNRAIGLDKPKAPFPRAKGTMIVPFKVRDGRIYVDLSAAGSKPFPALVDTGTPGTLIPGDVVQKLKLKPVRTWPISQPGGATATANEVIMPKLSLGKAELKAMHVIYLDTKTPSGSEGTTAVLGIDFLSHFKVVINYDRHQIALIPPAPPDTQNKEKP